MRGRAAENRRCPVALAATDSALSGLRVHCWKVEQPLSGC